MIRAAVFSILVVDDEPDLRALMQHALETDGYSVAVADSAAAALQLLSRIAPTTPDLFLLDVIMPGTDGFELAKKLRQRPALTNIPVLFVSAVFTPEIKAAAMRIYRADDFITKPFNIPEMLARIERSLLRSGRVPTTTLPILTDRQLEILRLLAAGKTAQQIATDLVICAQTVNYHIGNIYERLDATNRAEAIAAAYRLRLLAPTDWPGQNDG